MLENDGNGATNGLNQAMPLLSDIHQQSPEVNKMEVTASIVIGSGMQVLPPNVPHKSGWLPLQSVMYLDTNLFMLYSVWALAFFFIVVYIISVNQHILALIASWSRLYHVKRAPPPDISEWPSVSIVKPLLGVDRQLPENLETFFTLDYGGRWELLFCVEDPQDAALNVVHSLMEKYPQVDVRIFDKGGVPPGTAPTIINPMVRNMVQGYENARNEFVWISSARCRGTGVMLRDMISRACVPKVGLVHQMPHIWVPPPEFSDNSSSCPSGSASLGATMERLYFATSLARPYLALSLMRVTCFTGMSYIFRRAIMEEAGGLRSYGQYLAEDFQLSAAINRLGYRHIVSAIPAMQNNGSDLSLNTLKDRLVRWHRLRVNIMPLIAICLEPFQECLIVGAAASWALHFLFSVEPSYFFPAHIFVWFFFDALLFYSGHRNMGTHRSCCCCCCCSQTRINPLIYVITWMGLQLLPFYILFESLCNPRYIKWGKHTYKLSMGAVAKIVH